ncbi:hypothetical protein BKA69DRAFT_251708 [Paraphysoderma sedebokerense]|nr:hypothetical protein BKA69DRAFT_251708 [Paraphysoderma sedebokerense]
MSLSVHNIVQKIVLGEDVGLHGFKILRRITPVLNEFIVSIKKLNSGVWPMSLSPLLDRIMTLSKKPFTETEDLTEEVFESPFSSAYQEMYTTGICLPGFPPRRKLRNYSVRQSTTGNCNKKKYFGTFYIFCMVHKKCLGFASMLHGESAKTLFDIIYTRWEVAPN